jgi:hemerythrin-like domain-containing protein
MSATESLRKEHQLILKFIGLMERYVEFTLKHPENPILLDKAAGFINFIHVFADHFHHAKEEDILFRYFAHPGVLTHCNPLPQMLFEHRTAREYVRDMEQALQDKAVNALADNTARYAQLLREHIYKEDNILYPMGESGLSDQQKTELLKEFAEIERQLDSQALRDKYENLYKEFERALDEQTR